MLLTCPASPEKIQAEEGALHILFSAEPSVLAWFEDQEFDYEILDEVPSNSVVMSAAAFREIFVLESTSLILVLGPNPSLDVIAASAVIMSGHLNNGAIQVIDKKDKDDYRIRVLEAMCLDPNLPVRVKVDHMIEWMDKGELPVAYKAKVELLGEN